MAQYHHSIHLHYVTVIVFIVLLFKEYKAQCLSTAGSCTSLIYASLPAQSTGPPYSFIQTFNVSSCVSDHRLEISEISIWYQYFIKSTVTLDFQIEFFIPSSLDSLSIIDVNNVTATAQTSISLTTLFSDSRKRVRFTNLNITLGCNPHFAMFVYPLNCNGGADPACDSTPDLMQLGQYVCSVPVRQETLFVYDDTGAVPPNLASIDIVNPSDSKTDYRMEVDIESHNTTLCNPTQPPTVSPSRTPSSSPTVAPTQPPTVSPIGATLSPTSSPSKTPSSPPSIAPTQ
eukprot:313499_1